MKKLLIALFGALVLAGCTNDPYKIDPVATANAPWKVGELIYQKEACGVYYNKMCYREFLGVVESGHALVQDFYLSGVKATDPFLFLSLDDAKQPYIRGRGAEIEGGVIFWYENGQKWEEGYYQNGRREGLWTTWHENGQRRNQDYYRNDFPIGTWSEWDEDGKFIGGLYFGDI